MTIQYKCKGRHRLEHIRGTTMNGIDYVETYRWRSDRDRCALLVRCLNDVSGVDPANVRIGGGKRIAIKPIWAHPASRFASPPVPDETKAGIDEQKYFSSLPEGAKVLVIGLDRAGDYGTYTLTLANPPEVGYFDPILSSVEFSFMAECMGEFDCRPDAACPAASLPQPQINYLARDYAGFRQLMLDRMALLAPRWTERNPADTGMVLVELLAHLGDRLSYKQDAVATEAYLDTARRRTSVKRHARLVDYRVHEGCNARVWVQVVAYADGIKLPKGTTLYTRIPGENARIDPDGPAPDFSRADSLEVFETMGEATLFQGHNRMSFYTWGELECCLPAGATEATLEGRFPDLKPGDVLVFEEVRGPANLTEEDADPSRRHAVRLTACSLAHDTLYDQDVTGIEWAADDALPFPLFIRGGDDGVELSVASGNIVLADHGQTIDEELGVILSVKAGRARLGGAGAGKSAGGYPRLESSPLTYSAPYEKLLLDCERSYKADLDSGHFSIPLQRLFAQHGIFFRAPPEVTAGAGRWSVVGDKRGFIIVDNGKKLEVFAMPGPAVSSVGQDPKDAQPSVTIEEFTKAGQERRWIGATDLLEAGPLSQEFVVETSEDGAPLIRFGDGRNGMLPDAGSKLTARYRVGNGARGNVGREAIAHVVANDPAIVAVRNPLPASGGAEAESIEHVRQCAPEAFKTQLRAVTPQDYEAMAMKYPGVARAAATFRWTGSWHTVYVTVDRERGLDVSPDFKVAVKDHLEQYRMAGHDIEVDGPVFVPLEIRMTVRLKPGYFEDNVQKALLERFGSGILPDGRPGVFHPDNFSFGQPVYLSSVYRTAQEVEGVAWARTDVFQPFGRPDKSGLQDGLLAMGRLEIARLDNDRNHPENGTITFTMEAAR